MTRSDARPVRTERRLPHLGSRALLLLLLLAPLACAEDHTLPTAEGKPMLTSGTTLFSEDFESGKLSVNVPPCGQSSPDGGVWDGPGDRCRMDLVNDPGVCHTGSWCVHNDVFIGHQNGGSFMRSPGWSGQRTVYVKFWQKWRSDFQFDTLGKIMFLPGPSSQDNWYLKWDEVDATHARIGINAVTSGGIDRPLPPNLDSMTVVPGQWYEIEWQTTLRSLPIPTVCDASADVWINGTHTLQYTGLCGVDMMGGLQQLMVSGYYNGTSPVASTYWIDDIVASDSFIP